VGCVQCLIMFSAESLPVCVSVSRDEVGLSRDAVAAAVGTRRVTLRALLHKVASPRRQRCCSPSHLHHPHTSLACLRARPPTLRLACRAMPPLRVCPPTRRTPRARRASTAAPAPRTARRSAAAAIRALSRSVVPLPPLLLRRAPPAKAACAAAVAEASMRRRRRRGRVLGQRSASLRVSPRRLS
jgi:hypothetical protein